MKLRGGWYVVAVREGRMLALAIGPFKTKEDAEARNSPAVWKHAEEGKYAFREDDHLEVVMILTDHDYRGVFNSKYWLKFDDNFVDFDIHEIEAGKVVTFQPKPPTSSGWR